MDQHNVPRTIERTTMRRHLTGLFALNVPNFGLHQGGDWHQFSTWFGTEPEKVRESGFTNEEEYGQLLDRLGEQGLRDARAGLGQLNHPAASEPSKIWTATYERAAVEIAWIRLQRHGPQDKHQSCPPVDARELARWLIYPHQWLKLHWYAWKLRADLSGEGLRDWDKWRKSWLPWPH